MYRKKEHFSSFVSVAIIIKHKAGKRTIVPINNREKFFSYEGNKNLYETHTDPDYFLGALSVKWCKLFLVPEGGINIDYFEILYMKSFNFNEFWSEFLFSYLRKLPVNILKLYEIVDVIWQRIWISVFA